MGGRGSGGKRVGAGRKPKDALLRSIQGGRDRRPEPAPPSADPGPTAVAPIATIQPPADLTAEELAIWNRDAPLAEAERTLVLATASAFREFCELEALKNKMLVSIKEEMTTVDDKGVERSNPLLTHYRGAVQRLSTFRKDFKLAPFGKDLVAPVEQPRPQAAQQKRTYW